MREGKIEDILVLTEEEENTPLFVTPRARRDVQVKKSSYQGKKFIVIRSSVRALFHSLLVHLQARHRFELRIKRRTAERVVMIVSGQGALLEAELY